MSRYLSLNSSPRFTLETFTFLPPAWGLQHSLPEQYLIEQYLVVSEPPIITEN